MFTSEKMTQDQEQQVRILKRVLEGWRMVLLPLKSIFLWEQQWHPCAIFASTSLTYLIIWLLDLNFLATIAIVGLFVNFIDFLVPIICNSIYTPSDWTGQKEKMFEDICRSLVNYYNKILQNIYTFYSLRETSPYVYYIISISMSLTLAWMASAINNIFLLYIFSTVMLLWPGIQHCGIYNIVLSTLHLAPKSSFKTE
ncbi:PREDICTED: ADP-ribosylation factor-like protein 6-interacting protein 1 [Papilio polytes]|uniref:ADP-ribosylation factor-like protein 6-interacting protein 1 n=1 Tax=Papilio polytes TaxID=76194 RepID=UPI000675C378|nr:PREDICTED: ADP-ribosylation factor-like protein 6-interacting protein 1 [Papilio polytes]